MCTEQVAMSLTSESVQSASLPLEGIDNIHGGDSLPLGVFGVGDGIPDDVLEEHLQHATGLLVDEAGDTLHTTTTRQTPDGGLGDALDVIPQHLTVPLGASLSQPLASFAASSHDEVSVSTDKLETARPYYIYSLPSTPLVRWVTRAGAGLQFKFKRIHIHTATSLPAKQYIISKSKRT